MSRFRRIFDRIVLAAAVCLVLGGAFAVLTSPAGGWTEFWRLNSSRQLVPLYDINLDGRALWGIRLDTLAGERSLWLGHYGTRVDSSGIFHFPFTITNDFSQGWAWGTTPWCNIKQESNTILDVQLERGAGFSVDRGSGLSDEPGFRVYRLGAGRDSFMAEMRNPFSIFRTTTAQPNRVGRAEHVPFAVYSVGGDTLIVIISDTDTLTPLQIYDRQGNLLMKLGGQDTGKVAVRDSLKLLHGGKMLAGKRFSYCGSDGIDYGGFSGNAGYGVVLFDGAMAVQFGFWSWAGTKLGFGSNIGFIASVDTVRHDSLCITLNTGGKLLLPVTVVPPSE